MKTSFTIKADNALMYIIQNGYKKPSDEILGFFNDLGKKVLEIGVDDMIKKYKRAEAKAAAIAAKAAANPAPPTPGPTNWRATQQASAWKYKNRAIRKVIQDYFPGTDVPFLLLVKAYRSPYSANEDVSGSIEVTFPKASMMVDQKRLMDSIAERALLDGSTMPEFERPQVKTPKLYKNLIEEVYEQYKRAKDD